MGFPAAVLDIMALVVDIHMFWYKNSVGSDEFPKKGTIS